MAATNAQQSALSESIPFRAQVRASILKKALAIIEDVITNGNVNYTAIQNARAKAIITGSLGSDIYIAAIAGSTNIIASNVTYDFINRTINSDITEASLDSQVYKVVFQDLL